MQSFPPSRHGGCMPSALLSADKPAAVATDKHRRGVLASAAVIDKGL